MLNPFFTCTEESYIQLLSILHLLANLVAEYLVPVDLGPGNRKLPAQGLERGIWHCLIVFTNCCLVLIFCVLYDFNKLPGSLVFIRNSYRILYIFMTNQLDVAIFIVVNLNLKYSNHLGCRWCDGELPFWSPTTIPEVFRLKLVAFNTGNNGLLPIYSFSVTVQKPLE